jgi:hypothetical protein
MEAEFVAAAAKLKWDFEMGLAFGFAMPLCS